MDQYMKLSVCTCMHACMRGRHRQTLRERDAYTDRERRTQTEKKSR